MIYFILLLCTALLTQACQEPEASWEKKMLDMSSAQATEVDSLEAGQKLIAWVDDLRIRSQAFGKGSIVATLEEGDSLRYLGKRSPQSEKIELRGQTFDLPWIQVELPDGQVGWTHQGAVQKIQSQDGRTISRKHVQDLPAEQVQKLIALDVRPERLYSGYYDYVLDNGKELLHGSWEFSSQQEGTASKEQHIFKGQSLMGRKDGRCSWVWTQKHQKGKAHILFNAISESCSEGKYFVHIERLCLAYEGELSACSFAEMANLVEESPCR